MVHQRISSISGLHVKKDQQEWSLQLNYHCKLLEQLAQYCNLNIWFRTPWSHANEPPLKSLPSRGRNSSRSKLQCSYMGFSPKGFFREPFQGLIFQRSSSCSWSRDWRTRDRFLLHHGRQVQKEHIFSCINPEIETRWNGHHLKLKLSR